MLNNWITLVEQVTNHTIKNIVSRSDFTSGTELTLINALYFKSEWKYKQNIFLLEAIEDKILVEFPLTSGDNIEVEMMPNYKIQVPYAEIEELDAQVVTLPYKDEKFSMLLILPREKNGLADLEETLNHVDLGQLHNRLNHTIVNVFIPKFKIDSSINLRDPLKVVICKHIYSVFCVQQNDTSLKRN